MSNVVDKIFAEVCLDERIKDGIFRMDEEEHMDVLRDYFLKKGIAKEDAIRVTNRMVEGRFPERQAYNKDGILVTFPTPQHKSKAIQRGTHFEKNPAPQNTTPPKEEPPKQEPTPEPPKEKPEIPVPEKEPETIPKKIAAGGKELEVEPPRGGEKPEPIPAPQAQPAAPVPKTPERVAAEKEVSKQIMATDDTALSPLPPNINEQNKEVFYHQLNEVYKKCSEWSFREMMDFLKPHLKQ